MPDLDIVARTLERPWRAPYRLLKGGNTPDLVTESLLKALTATLRENGGMPGFEHLLMASRQAQSGKTDARTLAEVSRAIEQQFGQQPSAKLLARATQRNFAQIQAGLALPGPLSLAKEHLQSLLEHHFFARVNSRFVCKEGPFNDVQEARNFEAGLRTSLEPQLTELARRLISDPSASKLRAPRAYRRRRSTAQLLETSLSDGVKL